MGATRKTAVAVGILFLIATFSYMIGNGLLGSLLDGPDLLVRVSGKSTQVALGVLLELTTGAAVFGIGVLTFPVLRPHSEPIAIGYVGLRVVEAVVIAVRAIIPPLLVVLGQEYVRAGTPDTPYYRTLAALALELRDWTYLIVLITFVSGLILSYALYRSRLVPRTLSILGLIAHPLVITGALLAMFGVIHADQGVGLAMMMPGALFELLLPIWLFARGFKTAAAATWTV
ncbi:MAG: DUF4386 domain-containing protein [Planctomycetota bacterium]|jgi:hypothetical protein